MDDGVHIEAGPAWSFFRSEYPVALIDKATSSTLAGAFYAQRSGRGFWDGKVHLLNKKSHRFPTGLLPVVRAALSRNGYSTVLERCLAHTVVTAATMAPAAPPALKGASWRKYQLDAVEKALSTPLIPGEDLSPVGRGIIKVGTGGGKTEIAAGIIASLGFPKTLFVVHSKDLLRQTAARFKERLEIDVGIVGDSSIKILRVTVATITTLSSRMKKKDVCIMELVKNAELLFGDECHKAGAKSWYYALMQCPAPYRFGLSATPLSRGDGRDLAVQGIFGPILFDMPAGSLVETGVLARPVIHFVASGSREGMQTATQAYLRVYDSFVVNNSDRNRQIIGIVRGLVWDRHMRVVVIVRALEHGELLRRRLTVARKGDKPLAVRWVRGEVDSLERERAFKALNSGACNVLIASAIFDEGVDIPNIDAIVLAGAGKSQIKTIQRVGRGMRKGRSGRLLVVDFMDYWHRYLADHAAERLKTYRRENFPVMVGMGE